ncbi:MAG: hypothetical protein ACHWZW_20865 [Spirulina sp.]
MAVELGGVTLSLLTGITVAEQARIVHHSVPGMAGDLAQTLGRPSVVVTLEGIFYGATAAADLAQLRAAHLAHEPVDFFTEAIGEGYFTQVLIAHLAVAQRANFPDQFDFCCQVVEYVEPPEPALASPLGGIDADLLAEAGAFMDTVQNTLAEVSALTDLIANVPDFGNPTENLNQMLDEYTSVVDGGVAVLQGIRSLF